MNNRPDTLFPRGGLRDVPNLTSFVLPRLAAAALAFALALSATFVWRLIPVLPSRPDSSQELIGVLTPASFKALTWRDELVRTESTFWILRHDDPAARFFDVSRPVAFPDPDANSINTGCMTLTVAVDAAQALRLNTETAGSLGDPSKLTRRLGEIFREREVNGAYRPNMEERTELPSRARIEKTVIFTPSRFLSYGEVLEAVRLV